MTSENQNLHELASAFALDALDADERALFESHLEECGTCRDEVESMQEVAAMLAESTSATPGPDLRASVLSEIAQTPQDPVIQPAAPIIDLSERRATRKPQAGRSRLLLVAAASALVVVLGVVGFLGLQDSSTVELADAPDAIVTELEGADGSIQVIWSAERGEIEVIASGLAPAGDDLAYALWFLEEDGVAPALLFDSDGAEVRITQAVEDADPIGWGITIEPAEGSDQPTSDVIFQATI